MPEDRKVGDAKGRLLTLLRKGGGDEGLRSLLESDPSAVEAAARRDEARRKKMTSIDDAVSALRKAEFFSLDLETDGPSKAEATDPLRGRIVGVSFAAGFEPGKSWWFPFDGGASAGEQVFSMVEVFRAVQPVLLDPAKTLIGSNCKFDIMFLKANGVEVRNRLFDTVVADWMMDENNKRHGLKEIVKREFDVDLEKFTTAWASRDLVQGSRFAEYAVNDARYAFRVWERVHAPFLNKESKRGKDGGVTTPGHEKIRKLFTEVEMEIVRIFMEAEMEGVCLDLKYIAALKERMEKAKEEAAQRAFAAVGRSFKISSPEEVSVILFGAPSEDALRAAMASRDKRKPKAAKRDLVAKFNTKGLFEAPKGLLPVPLGRDGHQAIPGDNGFYSTDDSILAGYDHPFVKALLDYRAASQTLKFFVYAYVGGDPENDKKMGVARDGRVHPDFHQAGTIAGRFTCSEPNLQQIDTEKGLVKPMFVPPPGHKFVCGDFNQLQFRLAGHYAKSWFGKSNIADAYALGSDLHDRTMRDLGFDKTIPDKKAARKEAKGVNFAFIFGRGAKSFAEAKRRPPAEANKFYNGFHKSYPEIRWCSDKCRRDLCEKGYVESILGRRRNYPQHKGKDPDAYEKKESDGGPRSNLWWDGWVAWNAVVQGAESDLVRLVMRNIYREILERRKADPRWDTVKMLIQVHDEIVYQAPDEIAKDVADLMRDKAANSLVLKVPMLLDVGIGRTWEEAKA